MTDEEYKQLNQLAKDLALIKSLEASDVYAPHYQEAMALFSIGYRKIPENAVVITNEEYKSLKLLEKHHITNEYVSEYIELARKETVEKFLNMIYWRAVKHIKGKNKDECFIEMSFEKLDELAKQFGVEVEE